jgi:hypothetical protein
MVLGKINQTDTQVTYRVTSLDYKLADPAGAGYKYDNTTVGAKLVIAGVKLDVESVLASGMASVSYAAETSTGIVLDQEKTNVTKLFDVENQFSGKATVPFNAIVDVNEQRLLFTAQNSTVDTDVVTLGAYEVGYDNGKDSGDADYVAYGYALPATAVSQKIIVKGNFAFLGEAADNGVIVDETTYKIYADRIEGEFDAPLGQKTFSVKVPGDVVIPHQTFAGNIEVAYTTAASNNESQVTVYDQSAGEWTLNGAVVHVPFMPFRAGYSPIVNVSNTSTQDGDIEVLVYAQNDAAWVEPVSYQLSVAAKAESQTNITSALQSAGIEGDVAFDIIVNAPADDIAVNALFYRDGDRAVINTVDKN